MELKQYLEEARKALTESKKKSFEIKTTDNNSNEHSYQPTEEQIAKLRQIGFEFVSRKTK